ncbi:MAG: hypothetical protein QXR45_12755 [Candidatus Bathyarchaeia archaeon]
MTTLAPLKNDWDLECGSPPKFLLYNNFRPKRQVSPSTQFKEFRARERTYIYKPIVYMEKGKTR